MRERVGDGERERDVDRNIALTSAAFDRLRVNIFSNRAISMRIRT